MTTDGEVVVADGHGVASFALLRGRAREEQAFVWAFDLLECDGEDLRAHPLERRKGELKALLKRAPFGLALNDYVAGYGPALFAQACAMGLEGIVSKRRSSPYRSGRSPHWVKAKNPGCAAARREALEDWAGEADEIHNHRTRLAAPTRLCLGEANICERTRPLPRRKEIDLRLPSVVKG